MAVLLGIAPFEARDQAAAFVAERAQLIEFGPITGRDEPTIACVERKIGAERTGQPLDQNLVKAQILNQRLDRLAGSP